MSQSDRQEIQPTQYTRREALGMAFGGVLAAPVFLRSIRGDSPTNNLIAEFKPNISSFQKERILIGLGMQSTGSLLGSDHARAYRDVAPHEAAEVLRRRGFVLEAHAEERFHYPSTESYRRANLRSSRIQGEDINPIEDTLVKYQQSPHPGIWQVDAFSFTPDDISSFPVSNVIWAIADAGTGATPHEDQIRSDGTGLVDMTLSKGWADVNNPGSPVTETAGHGRTLEGMAAISYNGIDLLGADLNSVKSIIVEKITDSAGYIQEIPAAYGIHDAALNGAKVITTAFIGGTPSATLLIKSLNDARLNHDVLITAGTDDEGSPLTYPAALAGVVKAGVFDETRNGRASWSNHLASMFFPGTSIITFGLGSSEIGFATGSSMASAIAGALAVWARRLYPQYTERQIRQLGKQAGIRMPLDGNLAASMAQFYQNYKIGVVPHVSIDG